MRCVVQGRKRCCCAGLRLVVVLGQLLFCAVVIMASLGVGAKADNPNPDWVLVFQDEFSSSSFDGKKLKWGHKWNKIESDLNAVGAQVVYFPYTKGTSSTLINETLHKLRGE